MLGFCVCPPPEALPSISAFTCGEDFGQIQKFIFQRRLSANIATLTAAALLATWTALLAETDVEKVTVTPFFENFVLPPVEALTEGGDDNTTLDGVARVVGRTTPTGTGNFASLPSSIYEELEVYNCEQDLTVYMINEFSQIIGYSANGTTFHGIPVTNFFIGDKGLNGKNTVDKNMFRVSFRAGWSKKLKRVTGTDFDARYDL
jgi:hypothetical protein